MAQQYTKTGKRINDTNDRMSEGVISEINKQRKDQGQKGIGEYVEAPGGGTPASGGGRGAMKGQFEVVNSKEEADAIRAKNPNAKIRYNQPRNEDGEFTYNSANAKPLSTKNSRGHTPLPFLSGVDLTFIKKGSSFQYKETKLKKDKDGNPIYDQNGNEEVEERMVRVISSIDMTADELATACRKYFEHKGGFLGVVGTAVTKKGSPSKVEQAGAVGKTGEVDLGAKAQSTQQAVNAASRNKDVLGLRAEKIAQQTAFAKHLQKQQAKQNAAQPTRPTQTTQPNQPVGAGAGTGATNATPQQTKTTQPVNTNNQTPTQPTNTVNLSSLQNSMQNMMNQYLASKNGDSSKVNQGVSSQGKQNLMSKWLTKKQQ